MKRILLFAFLFIFEISLAQTFEVSLPQKGFYDEIALHFGSNFSKNKNEMTTLGAHLTIGYAFSSHFRAGLVFPIGYTAFQDENSVRYRSFFTGYGLNLNAKCYSDSRITLRADLKITGQNFHDKKKEWTMIVIAPSLQWYFENFSTQKLKPFVALGINSHYNSYDELSQSKEYLYLTPSISVGCVHRF